MKSSIYYKTLKGIYSTINNEICYYRRKKYIKSLKEILYRISNDSHSTIDSISIISTNCFSGRIAQDLKLKYNSPTVGLFFMYPDYIEFLKHLRYYLSEATLDFIQESKYAIANERRQKGFYYPIGILDNKVEIHFLHYNSKQEAAEKWYRRAKRVNYNNLLIIGMQQNLCSNNDIEEFDKLPFKYKIMFSTYYNRRFKSNEYVQEMNGDENVGDPYKKGHIFYKHLVSHFNNCI